MMTKEEFRKMQNHVAKIMVDIVEMEKEMQQLYLQLSKMRTQ